MSSIREDLLKYGIKIAQAGLVAGAGGNISARDGNLIWMKPSGFAMDDMSPADLCGMDLATGKQVRGKNKPTSEKTTALMTSAFFSLISISILCIHGV